MTELSIGEMLTQLIEHGFDVHEQRIKLVIQGIEYYYKKHGCVSQHQRATINTVWEVRQRRKRDKERGVQYNMIPDDFSQKTAERRKGHPRNNRPYKTQQDYEAEAD